MGVTFIAKEGTYTAPATLTTKTITENGTYSAVDDSANGYSSVTVEVEGGVTNTKKVVTGTLADPFGDIDVADLCSKLQTMDATAYLSVNASSLGQGTLESRPYADSTRFRTNAATMSNTVANTKAYGFDWNISSKELTFANVQNNNQMLDIMSYASGLTTTLTVIYHPISE